MLSQFKKLDQIWTQMVQCQNYIILITINATAITNITSRKCFCVEKDCWIARIKSGYKHFGHLKGRWCWWRSQRNLRLIWVRRSIFKTGDKCWRQTVICNSSCNEFPQELWIKTNQACISNAGIKLRRNQSPYNFDYLGCLWGVQTKIIEVIQ